MKKKTIKSVMVKRINVNHSPGGAMLISKFFLCLTLSLSGGIGFAQVNPSHHSVRGYTRKDGKYIAPHVQTNPNKTQRDNYSAKGNVNPFTGKIGTKTPKEKEIK